MDSSTFSVARLGQFSTRRAPYGPSSAVTKKNLRPKNIRGSHVSHLMSPKCEQIQTQAMNTLSKKKKKKTDTQSIQEDTRGVLHPLKLGLEL